MILDPPIPIPKLSHEETNFYKRTLFQNYVYSFAFSEGNSQEDCTNSSLSKDLSELLTNIGSSTDELIKEVLFVL